MHRSRSVTMPVTLRLCSFSMIGTTPVSSSRMIFAARCVVSNGTQHVGSFVMTCLIFMIAPPPSCQYGEGSNGNASDRRYGWLAWATPGADDHGTKSPIILYESPKKARTDYRIGLSAWTDKSLLDEGTFYPRIFRESHQEGSA